ncbi:MAG TPA: dephospho-CoA kinase [Thermomicrobiales bacterium]|nr:dephospho-CoA kinase [Thermomicrobiales bacterium]
MPDRFILGVTGNIASGKSTVSGLLAELGATVIDSDLVYRELVGAGQPLLAVLADRFGPNIVAADGSLDRGALGSVVFADPAALAELDRLTHPAVIAEVDARVERVGGGVVVLDAVKLVESGHADRCDAVWVVVADPEVQVRRLMQRNELPEQEARRRVESQPPLRTKLARADLVIDNNGTREDTREQVVQAWNRLPLHGSTGPLLERNASTHG